MPKTAKKPKFSKSATSFNFGANVKPRKKTGPRHWKGSRTGQERVYGGS